MPMDHDTLVRNVEGYFAAVDRKDVEGALSFLAPDVVFAIANFDVHYQGRDGEVRGMFERLFARYARVWHGDFAHVVQPPDRSACRFRVENTGFDGHVERKNNANFFRARADGLFDEVFVYMSGENALR
jgi:ketosteroid isomerase-like protein